MNLTEGSRWVYEELLNSITHGLGLALSIAGFLVLLVLSVIRGDAWHIAGCSIFGATLIFLYGASTLYHSFKALHLKRPLRILDHSAIYLLIAGTYTPFTLVNLRGPWGWSLFAAVWILAALGIVFKVFFVDRFAVASTVVYLLMGWLGIVAIKPILALVPPGGFAWLVAGGLAYTVGIVFFACRKVPYNHAIWHLFVLAGSICHYFAVVVSVLPKR
ncbi:MAG TPA: hemolysin III family protein [Blastocatellia bacterium]|nr:hemolysin III family protein [Blastocatellia bacterium]